MTGAGHVRAEADGGAGLVVLPTYNEADSLERVVGKVLDADGRLSVLVVDDGSPDGTGDIAHRLARADSRVNLLRRAGKLGLGSAYLEGFRWALERDFAWIIEMDADGSHDSAYLPGLLKKVEDADVVVGSRYLGGVNVVNWPISRLLLSYFANRYARIVSGLELTDLTSGFKLFRRDVLQAVDLDRVESTGYAFQIEMTFRAVRAGFRVAEIPIVFTDRLQGTSKMSAAIVREAAWRVWSLRLRALVGRL